MSTLTVEKVDSVDDFQRIVNQSNQLLSSLKPSVESYGDIYNELKTLNVVVTTNPSLQQITSEIQKIQSAKDRVSEILMDTHRNFLVRKRVCELLREGWAPFSSQNSAEKRKGEAFLKMSQFIECATEAEALYKATAHVMKNLDSKQENLSRQVTVYSLALKMNDFSNSSGGSSFEKTRQVANSMYSAKNDIGNDLKEVDDDKNDDMEEDKSMYDWK